MIKYISVGCPIMANSQVGTTSDHISCIIKVMYIIHGSEKCGYYQSSSIDHLYLYLVISNHNILDDKGFHVSSQFTEVII